MKLNKIFMIIFFVFLSTFFTQTSVYAGEKDDRCFAPKFRSFKPPNHAEVAPGSEISFHVKNVDKQTIEVTVKKIPIEFTLEDHNLFYVVTGHLPESLKGTYARISLKGAAPLGCETRAGWLVKISGDETPEQETVVVEEAPEADDVDADSKSDVTAEE